MSESRLSDLGSQENIYVPPYVNPSEKTERPGGTDYHPNVSEIDRVSTYTGLDDYYTLFAARHGRGALDQVPTMSEQMDNDLFYGNYTHYIGCRIDGQSTE